MRCINCIGKKSCCLRCKKLGLKWCLKHNYKNNITRREGKCAKCRQKYVGGNRWCTHFNYKYFCRGCKEENIGGQGICMHNNYDYECLECFMINFIPEAALV